MPHEHIHLPLIKILSKVILHKSRCRANNHCSAPTAHDRYHSRTRTEADSGFLKELAACYMHIALPPSDPRLSPTLVSPRERDALPRVAPNELTDLVFEVMDCKYAWGRDPPMVPPVFKELAEWKPSFSRVTASDLERIFEWMERKDSQWYKHGREYPERWRRRAIAMYQEWQGGQIARGAD